MRRTFMKKAVALGAVMTAVLSLAACSSGSNGTAPATSAPATKNSTEAAAEPAKETETMAAGGEYAQPESYPSKTIEFIVPANAGASLDLYTRAFNEALDLGTPLQITNMAGGSQTIGMMELANRKGDGYSMGIVAFAGGIIQPQLVDVTYDLNSFRPVAMASGPNCYSVCTAADSKVQDYDALIELMNSGEKIYWTAPNAGSPAHLAGLYMLKELGITNCEFVSYNGAAEALTAPLSGDVAFLITDDSVVAAREADKQVTGIVTLSDGRSELLPNVIGIDEKGISGMGAFDGISWVVVPADTPDEIYNWIKQQIDKAVTSDEYQNFLTQNHYLKMQTYTEQELKDMIQNAYDTISKVIELL